MKRNHANPCLIVEEIERQFDGQLAGEQTRVDRPMRKQQVVPGLGHEPRPVGDRPWTMHGVCEKFFGVRKVAHSRDAGAAGLRLL